MPQTMTAIEISQPGGAEVLKATSRPMPIPGPGQVLIRVAASGINRPDILQRQGLYPAPPGASDIPGLEVAGEVTALGADVAPSLQGRIVCALITGGGYADYCLADASLCLPVPKGLTTVQAAALPEALFTVWHNVHERGRLERSDTLLIHGGASGIGTSGIQFAKAFGSTVIATARGPEKAAACLKLGADHAIDSLALDFVEEVARITGRKGVNVILDMVGGDYIARNLKCLATEGRLVNIAYQKGSTAEINFLPVMLKRLTITGSTLRIQSLADKTRMARGLLETVWPWIEAGRIEPVIHATFPLAHAAEAHRLMETGAHTGKIVLIA
ncbi:putative NADPH quinone oxidoreductase [Rhodospirillaceae bacterium LM-1]|nr:putative NADPH quinone oxidoreductase [Rhodospirillaceae bacterium LM-1]